MVIESTDTEIRSTDVNEIVTWLQFRKETNRPVVCFLGSRAGGFYKNQKFYTSLLQYGLTSDNEEERFQKSFQVLSTLEASIRHKILIDALDKPQELLTEGSCLVMLMKEGLIHSVITTNIDPNLEKAMLDEGFEATKILTYGKQSTDEIITASKNGGVLLKIFGDLKGKEYRTAGHEFDLREDKLLRRYLESLLGQDILFIGFDKQWDNPFDYAMPAKGRICCYVNDVPPSSNMLLYNALRRRRGNFCRTQSNDGSIAVLKDIYYALRKRPAQVEVSPSTLLTDDDKGIARNLIFISYSHKDAEFNNRLKDYLKDFDQQGLVKMWDDSKIKVGDEWDKEIQNALKATKVAVLLLSIDFFNSEYIKKRELPQILEGASAGEIKVCLVVLGFCDFPSRVELKKYQTINSPAIPLAKMTSIDQDEIWEKVLTQIRDFLGNESA